MGCDLPLFRGNPDGHLSHILGIELHLHRGDSLGNGGPDPAHHLPHDVLRIDIDRRRIGSRANIRLGAHLIYHGLGGLIGCKGRIVLGIAVCIGIGLVLCILSRIGLCSRFSACILHAIEGLVRHIGKVIGLVVRRLLFGRSCRFFRRGFLCRRVICNGSSCIFCRIIDMGLCNLGHFVRGCCCLLIVHSRLCIGSFTGLDRHCICKRICCSIGFSIIRLRRIYIGDEILRCLLVGKVQIRKLCPVRRCHVGDIDSSLPVREEVINLLKLPAGHAGRIEEGLGQVVDLVLDVPEILQRKKIRRGKVVAQELHDELGKLVYIREVQVGNAQSLHGVLDVLVRDAQFLL